MYKSIPIIFHKFVARFYFLLDCVIILVQIEQFFFFIFVCVVCIYIYIIDNDFNTHNITKYIYLLGRI
jgi:hypothetical protein